jgi:hypothetical protein
MGEVELKFKPKGFVDKIGMDNVTRFIESRLSEYDISLIEWIKLLPLNKNHTLHGECAYLVKNPDNESIVDRGYRLRASVNVITDPPYKFVHWGRIPSKKHKQGWYSGEKHFVWRTLEEVAVHTISHECFHFLSHTKQVKYKNTEANANWWADRWSQQFLHQQISLF